jgi:hypothetical protein
LSDTGPNGSNLPKKIIFCNKLGCNEKATPFYEWILVETYLKINFLHIKWHDPLSAMVAEKPLETT